MIHAFLILFPQTLLTMRLQGISFTILLLWGPSFISAWTARAKSSKTTPTWDTTTKKWIQAPGDDGEYPYDPVGSLLRHGPAPFLKRVTDPVGYEQDVLGYMAKASVSRAEATGNMDARANNAADWTYQKMKEKKGAPAVDYTVLDRKQAILTSVWAFFITPLAVSVFLETFQQFGTTGPHSFR